MSTNEGENQCSVNRGGDSCNCSVSITADGEKSELFVGFDEDNGNEIQFVATSEGECGALLFDWDFGDGDRSSDFAPKHLYDTAEEFNVVLNVDCVECGFSLIPQRVKVVVFSAVVVSADIPTDIIEIQLLPNAVTKVGEMELSLVGTSATHIIMSEARAGGEYTDSFDVPNLVEGDFDHVQVKWTIDGEEITNQFNYDFRVLGNYRHTQYNTPDEAQCVDPPQNVYLTDIQCNFNTHDAAGARYQLRSDFVIQTELNGSGTSDNYGNVLRESYCLGNAHNPPLDAGGISFRPNANINGSCNNNTAQVDDATVAVNQSHPYLSCGDTIYIHTVGVKTVTDRCPACVENNYHHLDNYTTQNTACSSNSVGDLGNFITIKFN